MPIFGIQRDSGVDYQAKATVQAAPVGAAAMDFAQNYVHGTPTNALTTAIGLVPASVLDLADTVISSVTPGVSRNDVNDKFLGAVGRPGLTKWFDDNHGAIEVGSSIAGVIASSLVADGVLKPASFAMKAIRGLPFVGKIAQLDGQYNRAVTIARLANSETAIRGSAGAARFLDTALDFKVLGVTVNTSPLAAARGLRNAQIAKGLAQNVLTEGIMAATLHTNATLYDDSIAHNLTWSAGGLGIGVAIDRMIGTYALRKIANSEQIRTLNARAGDVTGKEADRLTAQAGTTVGAAGQDWRYSGNGALTDRITSQALDAAELTVPRDIESNRGRVLFGNREALATQKKQQVNESLAQVTTGGIKGLSGSGFTAQAEGLFAPLREGLNREPSLLYGFEGVGTTVDDLSTAGTMDLRATKISTELAKVNSLISNDGEMQTVTRVVKGVKTKVAIHVPLKEGELEALTARQKNLLFDANASVHWMPTPGEWLPGSLAHSIGDWGPKAIKVDNIGLGEDAVTTFQREVTKTNPEVLALRNDGTIYTTLDTKLEQLPLGDMLDMFHLGRQMAANLKKFGGKFTVPKNPSWFHLDLAEHILQTSGDPTSVKFLSGMTRETAQVESFAQKIEHIKRKDVNRRLASRGSEARDESFINPDSFIYQQQLHFNLPRFNGYQMGLMDGAETPVDFLTHAYKSGQQVRNMGYQELRQGLADSRRIAGLSEELPDNLQSLSGDSFKFMIDRDGNAIKPIIGVRRPLHANEWSQGELLSRQAHKQAFTKEKLMGPSADEFSRQLTDAIVSDPHFGPAGDVPGLADDQHRSFLPGAGDSAPQTTGGAFVNAHTYRERRDVDNITMTAARRVNELVTRLTQSKMQQLVAFHMKDFITQVKSVRNIASKLALDQFHSYRPGWELGVKALKVDLPEGKTGYQFILDHKSQANIARFEQAFNRELKEGQPLLTPNGTILVMDQLAMDTLNGMQGLHDASLKMKNTLLRSQGLKEIKPVPWYAPPPDSRGKYLAYTFDAMDQKVPQMTIRANTPGELARKMDQIQKDPTFQKGYVVRTQQSIGDFMSLWDKEHAEFIAPNKTAIQPNKHNYGMTGGPTVNNQAWEESLVVIRDSMINHGSDLRDVLFNESLKSAQARARVSRIESASGVRTQDQHSSIFDRYIQNIRGTTSLSAKDSFYGGIQETAERRINGFLKNDKPSQGTVYQTLKDYISTARPSNGGKQAEAFNKLSKELGQYMPYKNMHEYVESQTNTKIPKEFADIAASLSWFEAASRLRWLESMHAVANVGGILSNTSSVIRAMQPKIGESITETAARNGAFTMNLVTPSGRTVGMPNVPKLMWLGMKDAMSSAPSEFKRLGGELGYFEQEVAEMRRQWGAIDSKEGWKAWMFGNAQADKSTFAGRFQAAGGIDHKLDIISTKSEHFTRAWAMHMGQRVAESMGITGTREQLAFAHHEFANKLVANYDPLNRPEVFQGPMGAMLGLFQSYSMNFYQRMTRYLETGDARAIASQYLAQSSVFGIQSVPGWSAVNSAFFDKGQADGEDPVDSMYRRFGESADWLLHGTLSNIPKLFGQDGISLYTRGDSQIRIPGVPIPKFLGGSGDIGSIPVADTIKRVVNALGTAVDQFSADHTKLGVNGLAEIASNLMTNRPLQGLIEVVGAHGFDTSNDGQVVSESRGFMESAYRVLGVKAMQQQQEVEAFYSNKAAGEQQAEKKMTLRSLTRAAIRDERYNDLPGLFADYAAAGGDGKHYSRWVHDSFKAARNTRGERQLETALKNQSNTKNSYIGRLLDAQVGVQSDEENEDDYGAKLAQEQLIADHQANQAGADPTQGADQLGQETRQLNRPNF